MSGGHVDPMAGTFTARFLAECSALGITMPTNSKILLTLHPIAPARMSSENTHKLMGFLYGGFNTRRYTLVHGFCFKLFPVYSVYRVNSLPTSSRLHITEVQCPVVLYTLLWACVRPRWHLLSLVGKGLIITDCNHCCSHFRWSRINLCNLHIAILTNKTPY